MAQLLLEPFDGYAYADIVQIMRQANAAGGGLNSFSTSASPRGSAQYLSITNSGVNAISDLIEFFPQYPVNSGNVIIFGYRYRIDSMGQTTGDFPMDAGSVARCSMGIVSQSPGAIQCWLRNNADGTVSVVRGANGSGVVLGTTSASLALGTTYYVEAKITVHPSAGTVDIRFDGLTVLSLTGVNTAATGTAGWNSLFLPVMGFGGAAKMMDLYVNDDSGSEWNDFMGDMRLDSVAVNAAGTNNASTPSTGSDRSATADENPMNGDTDYNTFANINDLDTYNLPDAPVAGATILGLETRAQVRKTDAGTALIKHAMLINGTVYLGDELSVPSSYTVTRQPWSVNPDTSAAWTDTGASGFNSSEIGLKKTA